MLVNMAKKKTDCIRGRKSGYISGSTVIIAEKYLRSVKNMLEIGNFAETSVMRLGEIQMGVPDWMNTESTIYQ
jgi:hypothetical protein